MQRAAYPIPIWFQGLSNNAQNPAPAVPAAMNHIRAATAGGICGATLDANMAVSSVVSAHTAALVRRRSPSSRSNLRRKKPSSTTAPHAPATNARGGARVVPRPVERECRVACQCGEAELCQETMVVVVAIVHGASFQAGAESFTRGVRRTYL